MAIKILLPKLGFSMSEGVIAEWMAADGASVEKGQVLYTLENDKAVSEVISPASGVLRITGQIGETYPVGAVIGEIA